MYVSTDSRRRFLRGSLRMRALAMASLKTLTGARPDGLPETSRGDYGLPDHFHADRITFLIDATRAAGEQAFNDPYAEFNRFEFL